MQPVLRISSAPKPLQTVVTHLRRTLGDAFSVRPPAPAEAPRAFAFINSVRQEHGYMPRVQHEISESQFQDYYNGYEGIFLIIESHGHTVGTIAARVLPDQRVELQKFYLAPDQRGHGLGATVCSEFIYALFQIGYRSIVLETNARFHAANRLYRSMGFAPTTAAPKSAVPENIWLQLDRG